MTQMSPFFRTVQDWIDSREGRHSTAYYFFYLLLGLNLAMIGPTLPSLAAQTHSSLARIGWLFFAGAAGQTAGTALGARILDRVRGHPVLGLAAMLSAIVLVLVPAIHALWLLLILIVLKGTADGLVNSGTNTLILWTYRSRAAPYVNALHFFFGVGAFLSPLLVAQVIGIPGGYRWAYWALGACWLLGAIIMLSLTESPRAEGAESEFRDRSAALRWSMIIPAMLYLFFYVGAEIAFGGWVYTYAITMRLANSVMAAYLNSGFWLSFTIGRLISIPAATRVQPPAILMTGLLGSLGLLSLEAAMPGSRPVLWLVVAGLGFCLAPLWPGGYTLAGQSVNLTAAVSGIILMGDSLGCMVLPWLVGQVIGAAGPRSMILLVAGSLVCALLAFFAMMRLGRRGGST